MDVYEYHFPILHLNFRFFHSGVFLNKREENRLEGQVERLLILPTLLNAFLGILLLNLLIS